MKTKAQPMEIHDLSAFTRALARDLQTPPSHLALMNMLARAAGYRNVQHLKATQKAVQLPAETCEPEFAPALRRRLSRALSRFDETGKMVSWPGQTSVQALCLWGIWVALPPRQVMTERQISQRIDGLTRFRDAAQIRRGLVENQLVSRDRAGQAYRRQAASPPPLAARLIADLHRRRAQSLP